MEIHVEESYGSSDVLNVYKMGPSGGQSIKKPFKSSTLSIKDTFVQLFLPQGYPESVSDDYMEYQIWDTVQAFASSITGTLAAQGILKGVGVGDKNATVLGATMVWMLKDGAGMVGRIVFAWSKGSLLDCDCKKWRFFADILNDFCISVEIIAPSFPSLFTPLVCAAGVGKSIVGVAGGATRAALTMHQARRNNMADVSAKDSSQETLVNLLALLCNLIVIPQISGVQSLVTLMLVLCTCLHLYANYRAVTAVCMTNFNRYRFHRVAGAYLRTNGHRVESVANANRPELVDSFLGSSSPPHSRQYTAHIGCAYAHLEKRCSFEELGELFQIYANDSYLLHFQDRHTFHLLLAHQSEEELSESLLLAVMQMEVIIHCLTAVPLNDNYPLYSDEEDTSSVGDDKIPLNRIFSDLRYSLAQNKNMGTVLTLSRQAARRVLPRFRRDAANADGWRFSHLQFGEDEWRLRWGRSSVDI